MTLSDFVWLAIGETLLAGTFALGILVGVSLNRKGPRNGDCNTGTEGNWNHAGNVNAQGGTCRRAQGCADKAREANPGQRQTR
jgi:hypothetical protein